MSYTITVITTTKGADIVSAYLDAAGAEGVSIQDKNDLLELMSGKSDIFWDYVDDSLLQQDDAVRVVGYFAEPIGEDTLSFLRSMLALSVEAGLDMGSLDIAVGESNNDNDWYDKWKQFYRPIVVGKVTVTPAWQEVQADVVVKINPCMAFGTGEHESTQMCLDLAQRIDLKDKQIIDVGCGSGILGIAALKLGANHCFFADIDPDAVRNMQENAELNGITAYTVRTASLLDGCYVTADVLLANITADILMKLAPDAKAHIAEGGYMIISGIIAERKDEVLDAYRKAGFDIVEERALKDWRAYLLRA